ncbi:LapA family protein [Terrarubrum flagellatum]|uniref:LapA family protein n=1 Tax=Terrirubrum flagellatum TaxID=2895980 RepID=UPI003144F6C1
MTWLRSALKLILFAPIAAIVILFAIANRTAVTVSFDPVSRDAPALAYTLPLYLIVLIAIAIGVIAGGVGAWFAQGRHRKAARMLKREAHGLRADAERLKASLAARPSLPSS